MKRERTKKIWRVVQNVILYGFLAISVLSVVLTIFSKKDVDGATDMFGYQLRVVVSDSMAKSEHTDVSEKLEKLFNIDTENKD